MVKGGGVWEEGFGQNPFWMDPIVLYFAHHNILVNLRLSSKIRNDGPHLPLMVSLQMAKNCKII